MIPLGPFDLERPVGKGGMGVVWRAVHRDPSGAPGVPVAVKVLTAKRAAHPRARAFFRNEVRAVAALDHPNVIVVFDHGEIGAATEAAAEGRLAAGSPYLAMEWVSGGSLGEVASYREIRQTLRAILGALAHAHARGIVHRDIKPGNVLLATGDDLRPGLKLADFGLARLGEPEQAVAGTLAYMAPEQALGQWRDQGPWTDLYALGCLGWWLACRRTPRRVTTVLEAQSIAPETHAPFAPLLLVPDGFEEWLRVLIDPDPSRRYRRAADAAAALEALGDAPDPERTREHWDFDPEVAAPPTVADLDATARWERDQTQLDLEELVPARVGTGVPEDWRRPSDATPSLRLSGAGLGLHGLRAVPMVDRERERDRLWAALREVAAGGSARAVIASGPAGAGKTRLLEWLGERAHETGAASVMHGAYGPHGGHAEGLPGMVARHLRLAGLSSDAARTRVRRELRRLGLRDAEDLEAMMDLVLPALEAAGDEWEIRTAHGPGRGSAERHALLGRMLAAMARERPVLLRIDDVQWGRDAIAFVVRVLAAQERTPAPLLLALTVRDDLLAEQPEAAAELDALRSHPRAQVLAVDLLAASDGRALVQELLGVERQLVDAVAGRAAGNPLFAVQLVGDWVQRGMLETGPHGFRLRDGASMDVPDDLHAMWSARTARVLEGRAATDEVALEIAAVLGAEIDAGEWRAACAVERIAPADDLVERLVERRLARVIDLQADGTHASWAFEHGMLAESLRRRARDAGRLEGHHSACAEVLAERTDRGVAATLAQHLIGAGRLDEAISAIDRAIRELVDEGDFGAVDPRLDERERVLDRLGAPAGDRRRAAGAVLAAEALRRRGRYSDAATRAAAAADAARAAGDDLVLGRALRELGRLAIIGGRTDEARTILGEASVSATRAGDARTIAECARELGRIAVDVGLFDEGRLWYARAHDDFVVLGDEANAGTAAAGLAEAERAAERPDERARWMDVAREHYERARSRWGLAMVDNQRGDYLRHHGDLAGAREAYLAALRRYRALGAGEQTVVELNLGVIEVELGHWEAARALLLGCLAAFEQAQRRGFVGAAAATLLACDAALGRWQDYATHLERARELLAATQFVDADIARAYELAARIARERGEPSAARAALEQAIGQWEGLGRIDEATRVRAQLG